MERNVEIVTDSDKKKIVRIHEIRFKGKRSIDWRQVREYLKDYVGAVYEISETKDLIYIGSDLPDEYTGSRYTHKLMGTLAKIDTMHVLNFLFMVKRENSRGIIVLGQQY